MPPLLLGGRQGKCQLTIEGGTTEDRGKSDRAGCVAALGVEEADEGGASRWVELCLTRHDEVDGEGAI